jgi:RNA polymerase sigma-70 factor (ECF subfamily)
MEKGNVDVLFREKYEKYSKMLFKIAFLHLGNAQDAEDVLQNVFIKLLYNSPNFNDDEHEKAWLIRVTQNQCKNVLKSSSRNNCQLNENITDEENSSITKAIDISMKIRSLPANYKTAIFLYYYEDLNVEEIAKILKISQSAVKMRLKRGREILKTELEEYRYE